MPTFVTLIDYTQDGVETLIDTDSEAFLTDARDVVKAHGGELTEFYLTLGGYDAVAVTEFPDAESATQALLTILDDGDVETETLRAFTEGETRDLVGSL